MVNFTCNSTQDDMRIGSSEVIAIGPLTFHEFGIILAAGCSLIAILLSFYLIWMHALHYTKPYEQRHIIRILFMIPVYSAASFLSFWYYWHAIYFQVISDCYEAFAIASFFALLCHYVAPNLHDQKEYFRGITPKPWVLPINWLQKLWGGEKGPWRTPRSGLTWFNVIWAGIYQYCFIRVSMTITAVVTQYFGRYCESSDSPVFAHIWILVIESIAVSIAMYMVIQFYIQLREDLAAHRPFLKVLAIKLVIFLSFWQSFLISVLTSSTFNVISTSSTLAYPDIKVGIPSLLLCIEMAIFAVLHLFAFPWKPYQTSGVAMKYPAGGIDPDRQLYNQPGEKQGGFMGFAAFVDAMNPWDLVKAFARGMRWLFVGRKTREVDKSYSAHVTLEPQDTRYKGGKNLPIANEFRRSGAFGGVGDGSISPIRTAQADPEAEEGAGLIAHAQPHPLNASPGKSGYVPARQRYDADGHEYASTSDSWRGEAVDPDHLPVHPGPGTVRRTEQFQQEPYEGEIGMAVSAHEGQSAGWPRQHALNVQQNPGPYTASVSDYGGASQDHYASQPLQPYDQFDDPQAPYPPPHVTNPQNTQAPPPPHHAAHSMLWGPNGPQ